eukprot:gene22549-29674_t
MQLCHRGAALQRASTLPRVRPSTLLPCPRVRGHYHFRASPSYSTAMSWLWTFGSVPEIDAVALKEKSEAVVGGSSEALIIDVRTAGEYTAGHIAGSKNASFLPPWGFASRVKPLLEGRPKDTEIICICLSAHRSIGALKWLKQQGYENSFQLKAGMQDWRARKLPEDK